MTKATGYEIVKDHEVTDRSPSEYHYRECGLDHVWLVDGWTTPETPYGKGVVVEDVDGLHACIASWLVDKPDALTGKEFRFLRIELDLSQKLIGEMFGIGEREIRNLEKSNAIGEPYNKFIRHLYCEKRDPKSSFVDLFERLRKLDIEWHASLTLTSESGKWRKAV